MMQPTVESLVNEHSPMVRRISLKVASRLPANIELDDLIQAGMIGLLDAARRYKYDPVAQFTTYATSRIRGSIIDELRRLDWAPRAARAKSRTIESAVRKTEHELGRRATDAEIAEAMGVPIAEYYQIVDEAQGVQVVHYEDFAQSNNNEESSINFIDSIQPEGGDCNGPDADYIRGEFQAALATAIGNLPEKEMLVLSLAVEQDLNSKEIAEVMEITPGRVSQIRTLAISRLRAALHKDGWSLEDSAGLD